MNIEILRVLATGTTGVADTHTVSIAVGDEVSMMLSSNYSTTAGLLSSVAIYADKIGAFGAAIGA